MSRNYGAPGARMMSLTTDRAADAVEQTLGLFGRDAVNVGITGLSRSGKTIFATTALNNLSHAKRFSLFTPIAENRLETAHFESPTQATTPRFPFEQNLDALFETPPKWPAGTTRISQIQLKLKCKPRQGLASLMAGMGMGGGPFTANLVDYPGEWLTDLPMMQQSFRQWSDQELQAAHKGAREALSEPWRRWLAATQLRGLYDQRIAERLHSAYRAYLQACKSTQAHLSRIQPGRFLVPGDLEGSDALTFCPLPEPPTKAGPLGRDLYSEFEKRFEFYKAQVIAPFFDAYISRIDRQIVLVDLLSALNGGIEAVEELRDTLLGVLAFFKPGQNNPLQTLFSGRRVERLMFCATKADHLPPNQHEALQNLLTSLLFDETKSAQLDGATVKIGTLSALRAALPTTQRRDGKDYHCVVGVPRGGDAPRVYFPGTLDGDWRQMKKRLEAKGPPVIQLLDFDPPQALEPATAGLPHLRVDEAMSFLIGDLL